MTRTRANQLEELYTERFSDFVRVATTVTGSESQAIDAVQETFARALASLASFRGDGALAGWVWRILVNTARTQRSTRTREVEQPAAMLDSLAVGDGQFDDEWDVRGWIATLPERQRLTVFLRYFGDLDYAAIAYALDIEIGTVSAALNAAHKTLRRLLEEEVSR